MHPDLQLFVRESLTRGLPREAIRAKLAGAGWPRDEVEAALAAWAETDFPIPVPQRRPSLSAREAFLYLVMFVTLYTTAFNVGVLLFQMIERWVPDPVRRGFGPETYSADQVRNGVAAVLIAFPIFLSLAALIGRSLAREPEKRASPIRKWLTYLTLFVAALVLIGDLTFLVSRLLSGELPPRFLLKTLVVFAIAGTVFGHYLNDLRREEAHSAELGPRPTTLLARAAAVAVLIVLGVGFVMAGSPGTERERRIDAQRVQDLQALTASIDEYYRERDALPQNLDALPAVVGAPRSVSRDPRTGESYDYRTVDSTHYELCAVFALADTVGEAHYGPMRPGRFWVHPAGRSCFTLRVQEPAAAKP